MYNEEEANLVRRVECEEDGMYFNRYFFKQNWGFKMVIGQHHQIIQDALDRTLLHPSDPNFISRLIINIAPGYSKTMMGVINYIARGLAINPMARFIHTSYSHSLALENSASARNLLKSPEYQAMWNVKTRDDSDAKEKWWTEQGGGVYATSSKGQVTGFRAGHMNHDEQGFCGALIIDDPMKADKNDSPVEIESVNNNYEKALKNRLAVESIPVILIMQRLHNDDLSGFLLKGGSGEKWHHVCLPTYNDPTLEYDSENTHGIPITPEIPEGWLWEFKHNDSHAHILRANRRVYSAQYQQRPDKFDADSCLWTDELIAKTRQSWPHNVTRTLVSIDPAVSNTKTSDEHGIVAGTLQSTNQFSIIADRTLKGTPKDWAHAAITLYEEVEADAIVIEINQGGDMCEDTLRNAGYNGRIIKVRATKGKVTRAEPIVALYELGYVAHKGDLKNLEREMVYFDVKTGLSEGRSPNRVDALVWLLTELSGATDLGQLLDMAMGS